MKGSRWLLVIVVGLAAAFAGIGVRRWSNTTDLDSTLVESAGNATQELLQAPLVTVQGDSLKLSAWKGKVLVVNFWATWCPPCREEMPEFSLAQDRYGPNGVQFVGIAIDNVSNVVEFRSKSLITYPLLIAPADMTNTMARLGNQAQALPFTVIINRDGKLVSSHLGRLSKDDLATKLAALL